MRRHAALFRRRPKASGPGGGDHKNRCLRQRFVTVDGAEFPEAQRRQDRHYAVRLCEAGGKVPTPGGSHRHRYHRASWQGQKPGRYVRPQPDHVCTRQQDLLGGLLPPVRHRPHSPFSDCWHHRAPCPCLRYTAAGHGKCAVLPHHPGPAAAASTHTERCSTSCHQDRRPPSHQAGPSAAALVAGGAAYPCTTSCFCKSTAPWTVWPQPTLLSCCRNTPRAGSYARPRGVFRLYHHHAQRGATGSSAGPPPQLWNSLPASIRQSPSLPAFKNHLKTHLYLTADRWLLP